MSVEDFDFALHNTLWAKRMSDRNYFESAGIFAEIDASLRPELFRLWLNVAGTARHFYPKPDPDVMGGMRVGDSYYDAWQFLRTSRREFKRLTHLLTALQPDALEEAAENAVHHCLLKRTLIERLQYAEGRGITLPRTRYTTGKSTDRRLKDRGFWKGKLRRALPREAEEAFRRAGWVHAKAAPYLSDSVLGVFRTHVANCTRALKHLALVSEQTGEILPLDVVANQSLSNPVYRNAELMTHARGVQEYASRRGDICLMVTATCPSRFHPRHRATGEPNAAYDGSSVRTAQRWLTRRWASARARLKKAKIPIYGWRVAEPHHDGTPHWHLMIYCAAEHADLIFKAGADGIPSGLLARSWLREREPGSDQHRIRAEREDASRGSAVGYLAKYLQKNLDGHGPFDSESADSADLPVGQARERAILWARLHGIRQFQCFGQPLKSLWREARRAPAVPDADELADVVNLCCHTEEGGKPDWGGLIDHLGGHIDARARGRALLDYDVPRCIDRMGRRVLKMSRYGEFLAERPCGLRCIKNGRIFRVATHPCSYVRVSIPSAGPLGPVGITVTSGPSTALWSNPVRGPNAPPPPAPLGAYWPGDFRSRPYYKEDFRSIPPAPPPLPRLPAPVTYTPPPKIGDPLPLTWRQQADAFSALKPGATLDEVLNQWPASVPFRPESILRPWEEEELLAKARKKS